MPRKPLCALGALALALAGSAAAPPNPFTYSPAVEAALDRISADGLRGNLSFLASDLLEGRDTPSRGLDVAAEYIAAQFRKAGLEPAGDDGYFQTGRYVRAIPVPESFELSFRNGDETATIRQAAVEAAGPVALDGVPVIAASLEADAPLPGAAEVAGKVIVARWQRGNAAARGRLRQLRALKPALVLTTGSGGGGRGGGGAVGARGPRGPWAAGSADARARAPARSVRFTPRPETPVTLRNVVGVLRGSDPALRDTCVLLTAHYDHIGAKPGCTAGDCIFNGANDNASGTASVIEIAAALAGLERRPRRSIVFIAFFGEERGLLGSTHYARRPVFPLEKTAANINLEQLGRTDSGEGPQIANATFTGFEYSDVPAAFQAAGELTGVTVYQSAPGNRYFSQSDNIVFANAGVPAHTVSIAYTFPDYHGLADHPGKIDYDNMARVNRMLALGAVMVAENPVPPRWNEGQPQAAPYVRAWKERHGAAGPAR